MEGAQMNPTDWLMVCLTFVIAVFTILVWRVYARIALFTGAMESHSTMMLRIEAKKNGIPVTWWDPTLNGPCTKSWPQLQGEHGKEAVLEQIYIGVPVERRKYQPTCCCAIRAAVRTTWICIVSLARCWRNGPRHEAQPGAPADRPQADVR